MAFLPIEDDKIVSFSDVFLNGSAFIQPNSELVEIGRLEPGAG